MSHSRPLHTSVSITEIITAIFVDVHVCARATSSKPLHTHQMIFCCAALRSFFILIIICSCYLLLVNAHLGPADDYEKAPFTGCLEHQCYLCTPQ